MSALVVGLLISNSSASFTSKTQELTQISTEVISLDRMLRRYGPETQDMRAMLRGYAEATMQDLFPNGPSQGPDLENGTTPARLEQLQGKILALRPASPVQHWLQVTAQGLRWTCSIRCGCVALPRQRGGWRKPTAPTRSRSRSSSP